MHLRSTDGSCGKKKHEAGLASAADLEITTVLRLPSPCMPKVFMATDIGAARAAIVTARQVQKRVCGTSWLTDSSRIRPLARGKRSKTIS